MLRVSFVILMFAALASIARSEDSIEPEQCNGPPPIRMNPDDCCRKPIFKADFRACINKTRQIITQLFQENQNDEALEGVEDACLGNCFSENNIFTNDGINRDELVKILEKQTDDSVWNPIHPTAVDKCIEVLKPDMENIQNTKWIQKCNRVAVKMLICLNGQYFVNCPATYFGTDNENCKEFQDHIKTCPMPKGGPWGRGPGGNGFGGKWGPSNRGFNFDGPPPHIRSNFGAAPNFRPGPKFGPGPNFRTGEVFGFL